MAALRNLCASLLFLGVLCPATFAATTEAAGTYDESMEKSQDETDRSAPDGSGKTKEKSPSGKNVITTGVGAGPPKQENLADLLTSFEKELTLVMNKNELANRLMPDYTIGEPIGFHRLPKWLKRFRFPDYGRMNSPNFDEFTQTYWWE